MRILCYTAPTPADDLALEEALHLSVEDGSSPNVWRFWQAKRPAVILGTGQESAREANLEQCRAEDVPVLRRHSGGGCVLIGPGALNFSAFYRYADLPGSGTIKGAMEAILVTVQRWLAHHKVESCLAGLSDLAVTTKDGTLRKIGGNSQARKKHSVVVHGTILADPDWARLGRVLAFPSSVPDYRAGRDHRAFLTSLRELNVPTELNVFSEGLCRVLASDMNVEVAPRSGELERAAQLQKEKYGTPEWNFRR